MPSKEERYKPLPIGIDSFEEIITQGYYYVDKTNFIKELIDMKGKVTLFTRPRRFGKTLNMSMLNSFFQLPADKKAADKQKSLFQGLSILESGKEYIKEMGQYPVIFLSLKGVKQGNWEDAYTSLCIELEREFERYAEILDMGKLSEAEQGQFTRIRDQERWRGDYIQGLRFLSDCLEKAYGRKTVILIDEYDVPLEAAYAKGYYEEMVDFIRSLFESALKTNNSLAFAMLSGCLRIAKESIFTGLNNLEMFSVASYGYTEYFGFTPEEVRIMLQFYGLEAYASQMQEWYDGYLFGDTEVYNPWSVINHLKQLLIKKGAPAKAYWANTSGNSIVRTLIEKADAGVKGEIETLIGGGSIEKPIHEDITYDEVGKDMDSLWNFLYFTGYLSKSSERQDTGGVIRTLLRIPNKEVALIYHTHIQGWFESQIGCKDLNPVYRAVLTGDWEEFERRLNELLMGTISYMDGKEAFYHGFLAGVLSGITVELYQVKSNRESGNGRSDLLLIPPNSRKPAVVLELKAAETLKEMDELAELALLQIREKGYKDELELLGCSDILCFGISFFRKECRVKLERIKS